MKKLIIIALLFIATSSYADYVIPTTAELEAQATEAATYAGYTDVDAYVAMRGQEEINKASEAIRQNRSGILSYLLYKNICAEDRATLEQIADKYK